MLIAAILSNSAIAESEFIESGKLNVPRHSHTATLLLDGNVLVTGGHNGEFTPSSELYEPATGLWTESGDLNWYRDSGHTATLLNTGEVLVTGGLYSNRAELYNPSARTWSDTESLIAKRVGHTATLLPNGNVLVVGGVHAVFDGDPVPPGAEIYNHSTKTWTATNDLNFERYNHTATLLKNGQVLIAGGGSVTTELYNPVTDEWNIVGDLHDVRSSHTATLLTNGKVLLVGGVTNLLEEHAASEIFDPNTNEWTVSASLAFPRKNHTANLLPSGKVLVTGGYESTNYTTLSNSELYDPDKNNWTNGAPLVIARNLHTATLLQNNQLLVSGGIQTDYFNFVASYAESSELYLDDDFVIQQDDDCFVIKTNKLTVVNFCL